MGNHNAYIGYTLKNWNPIGLQGPFGMVFSMWSTKFVTLNRGFILTYSIDLVCLAFVVNGGRCQHNWRTSIVWHSKIFHVIVLPMLKISFFFKLEWLKTLTDILGEDYSICGN